MREMKMWLRIAGAVLWVGLLLAISAVLFGDVLPRLSRTIYVALGVFFMAYGVAIIVLDPVVRRAAPNWGQGRRAFGYLAPTFSELLGAGFIAWACLGSGFPN